MTTREWDPHIDAIERLREEFKRRIKTRTVLPRTETARHVVLGAAGVGPDHHANGRRMGKPRRNSQPIRPLTSPVDGLASWRPELRKQIPTQSTTGCAWGALTNWKGSFDSQGCPETVFSWLRLSKVRASVKQGSYVSKALSLDFESR